MYKNLPRMVFNSPLLEYVNFKDGSHINLKEGLTMTDNYEKNKARAERLAFGESIPTKGLSKTDLLSIRSFLLELSTNAKTVSKQLSKQIINFDHKPEQTIMKDAHKIEIAKEFISMHKHNDVEDWQPFVVNLNDKLLTIYANMTGGIYGEARMNEFGDMELEIDRHDSKNGTPIIFEWEI